MECADCHVRYSLLPIPARADVPEASYCPYCGGRDVRPDAAGDSPWDAATELRGLAALFRAEGEQVRAAGWKMRFAAWLLSREFDRFADRLERQPPHG